MLKTVPPQRKINHHPLRPKQKFNNRKTKVPPYQCDSMVEAAYINLLIEKRQTGSSELIQFLFHPKFHFASGVTWEADTLEFYLNGWVRVVDVKGEATLKQASFKDKMKLMAEEYPEFEVWIVQRSASGRWLEQEYAHE